MVHLELSDQPTVKLALDLLEKAVKAAETACEKLGIEPVELSQVSAGHLALVEAMNAQIGREEWTVQQQLAPALRLALDLYRDKLEKIKGEQLKLGIEAPDDTEQRITAVKSTIDAGKRQPSLALSR